MRWTKRRTSVGNLRSIGGRIQGKERGMLVDRTTMWGNPFIIGKDGDRTEVVRKYVHYLAKNAKLLAALPQLRGRVLWCWCNPSLCHGLVLACAADYGIDVALDRYGR